MPDCLSAYHRIIHRMTQQEIFNITPTTFTYGGEVMGRLPGGKAVFTPFALPGETIRIRLIDEKKGFARAELVEVLEPSPARITPRCVHFGLCGGCAYQHIPYEEQLDVKREIVRDQLERIGGFKDAPVDKTIPSPNPWYYRNHVQFHLDSEGKLCYSEARSNRLMQVLECHLPEESINEIWPHLDFEPDTAIERVSLRRSTDDELMMVLESSDPETPEMSIEELPLSVVHLSPLGPLTLAGSPEISIEVLDRPFVVSAGSFFQVNTLVAETMVKQLLENLPLTPESTLLELYSGAGLFSAFLAPRVKRLTAVESASEATQDFETNLDEFDNVELYEAPVEDVLPYLQIQPDIVLADPPRAGLGRKVVEALLKIGAPTIAYISCDPSTLARDLKGLSEGGYRLVKVTPFDMFPQTYHIETVVLMQRVV